MKNAKLVFISLSLFLVALVALSFATQAVAQKPGRVVLNMGSTASVYAVFVYCSALARTINKHAPGISVNIIESGATYDNLRRIKEGVFDFAPSTSVAGIYEMYSGLPPFKGTPWRDIRLLWLRESWFAQIYVRKDTGIKSLRDLAGKKFSPGIPGGAPAKYAERVFKTLGIKVDLVHASLRDAKTAIEDRRIVGVCSSSPQSRMDAGLAETHMKTPLTVIGLTKEETEAVTKEYPVHTFVPFKVGQYAEAPEAGGFFVGAMPGGTATSKGLSEDIVYRMTKAIHENHKEVAAAYPPAAPWDPVVDAIRLVPAHWDMKIHAGMVRYAREKGIEVPARLIPPEYRGK